MYRYELDVAVMDMIRYCMEDQADPNITQDDGINKMARAILNAVAAAPQPRRGVYVLILNKAQRAFLLETLQDYTNPAIINNPEVCKSAEEAYDVISDEGEVNMNGVNASVQKNLNHAAAVDLDSAGQDFIRIGNKVIPTNTMDMGYADYDTVARKGREDYEAQEKAKADAAAKEEADRKAAELAAKGAKLYDQFMRIVNDHHGSTNELDSKLNDILIPASGMAETFAGELLRAAERIGYRYNNDGDVFYADYGLETAGGSACFLGKYGDEYISKIITDMADHEVDWPGYDKAVDNLFEAVVAMLAGDPELFKKAPPEDSRECHTEELDKWKEWHTYSFEISEYDFEYPISQGWLSNSDIDDWIRGIAEPYDCEIEHPYRDYWELTGLDSQAYGELNEYYTRWVDEWIEELASEHEEEEEYDDEEEEE